MNTDKPKIKLIDGLKPCPFCARQPTVHRWSNVNIFTIICECGAESPHDSPSSSAAKKVWNRRIYKEL